MLMFEFEGRRYQVLDGKDGEALRDRNAMARLPDNSVVAMNWTETCPPMLRQVFAVDQSPEGVEVVQAYTVSD